MWRLSPELNDFEYDMPACLYVVIAIVAILKPACLGRLSHTYTDAYTENSCYSLKMLNFLLEILFKKIFFLPEKGCF